MQPDEIVAAVRPRLRGALIATDFDGTLAPLVPDPQDSRPVDGAIQALARLANRGAQVAVVTGRDAATVVRLGGLAEIRDVLVAGLYGMETWTGGELSTPAVPPAVDRLRDRLPAVVASAGDAGVWVEDKRLSLVVHTRPAADPQAALERLRRPVSALGAELGFEVHPGSDVLELRLPGFDKAGVLAGLAAGRPAVMYLGDDIGDLPAFAEVRRLREAGTPAYSLAVRSSGVQELDGAADADLADPAAAADLLARLAG